MENITMKPIKASKNNTYLEYDISIISEYDPKIQLEKTTKALSVILKETTHGIKVSEALEIDFIKPIDDKIQTAYFKTKAKAITTRDHMVRRVLGDINNELLNKITSWISEGSGWAIGRVKSHRITIIKYKPLRGSSFLPLPDIIKNRKGLINIKNEKDNECFRWCHLAYLFPVTKHPQRITKYKEHKDKLNYEGITFPVKLKDVPKIEEMNDIRFNIFGVDLHDKKSPIYPLYISNKTHLKNGTCELLLIEEGKGSHYVWIKNFNKLMHSQTKNRKEKFFCKYCIQHFTSEEILNKHIDVCLAINGTQKIGMPKPGSKIEFKNHHKQLMAPFVIYADFEAITKPINEKSGKSTEAYQHHIACGYGYKLVCTYDNAYSKPAQVYRGSNAVYKFIEKMLKEEEYCTEVMSKHFNKEMVITRKEEQKFKKSQFCHICGEKYTK